ncbi:MAG TPA: hypothetical protein VI755_04595 [Anaerolineales bacterium]|nr:hypothetical protein [Anaerolineales bacterium]
MSIDDRRLPGAARVWQPLAEDDGAIVLAGGVAEEVDQAGMRSIAQRKIASPRASGMG